MGRSAAVSTQRRGKQISAAANPDATIEVLLEAVFLLGLCRGLRRGTSEARIVHSRVEAGSNTSTVALRVVGGDETGSLESETVNYGRKSHGTRDRKLLLWPAPVAITNDRRVLSSETALHINKPATDSNKDLVVLPRWVLYSKTDGLTDGRS
jgi:hypothetical protein